MNTPIIKTRHQVLTTLASTALAVCSHPALADGQAEFAQQRGWASPIQESAHGRFLVDRLEYAFDDNEDTVNWEVMGWYGGDYNRLWLEGEGEDTASGGDGGAIENLDLLYGRLIAPYWEVQAGIGYQEEYGPGPDQDRTSAVVGLQGLAPYWFEVDTNLRVSEDGDASADFEAEYDLLLTQRWVLQPRLETAYAFDEVEEFGVGKGLTNVKLGLRLRYEIRREFAPYVGIHWSKKLGDTADLAEAENEDTERGSLVAGVRMWF